MSLVLERNGQLPYYQSPPLYMIPRHIRLIHLLPPISQRSISVLSLTIFLVLLTSYLLFLLEFQIVHLNYVVSSTVDMQSCDLLAVTAELFHWQWWCWRALQSLGMAFIGATMKAPWPEGNWTTCTGVKFCIKMVEVGHIQETLKELRRHLNCLKQCHKI